MECKENPDKNENIRDMVRAKYANIARKASGGLTSSCCIGAPSRVNILDMGKALDYTEEDLLLALGEAKRILSDLGFKHIKVTAKEKSKEIKKGWNVGKAAEVVFSAYIQAVKPDK